MHRGFNAKTAVILAIFAAIYALLRSMPTFPIIGVTGGTFTLADTLPSVYGMILGPYLGSSTILFGTFLSFLYGKPILFLGLDFLPGAVNAMIVGFLAERNKNISFLIYLSLLILFLVNPYTTIFISVRFFSWEGQFFFAWMHVIVLLLLASPLTSRAVDSINSKNMKNIFLGTIILSFIGIIGQHLMGNLLYEGIFGFMKMPPSAFRPVWYIVFWLYPVERTVLAIMSTLIGAPVVRMVRMNFSNYSQLL